MAEFLQAKGWNVIGTYGVQRSESFPKLRNLRFVYCDLRDGRRLAQLLDEHQPAYVFHLGGQSLPTASWRHDLALQCGPQLYNIPTINMRHSDDDLRIAKSMRDNTIAVLLVGGMGTRLRTVLPSTPKPMSLVGKRPFLELLVHQLRYQGIRRLVMCTGHLAEQIENEFGNGRHLDVQIEYSKEPHPLGTAGAVKFAQRYLTNAPDFLVMNGDSLLEADLHRMLRFHRAHRGLISVAVLTVQNAGRYGTVQVGPDNKITRFEEKTGNATPGLVNAGVYVFNRAIFEYIPEGPTSLERDVFPMVLDRGVYALEQRGLFIDIGTPEDYAQAQAICDRLSDVAHHTRHSASAPLLENE